MIRFNDCFPQFADGKIRLVLDIPKENASDMNSFLQTFTKGKMYCVEPKPYVAKRSLDANGMCWALINKLSAAVARTPENVYRDLIKDIGGNCETVCITEKAAPRMAAIWSHNGLGWVTETFPSKVPGCVNMRMYYGSSVFDTKEMSRMIDLVIQECQQQGIEVISEKDKALLLEQWGNKDERYE